MKIHVLDFDGVIVDSIDESLFSCFNAYLDLVPDTSLFGGKKFTFKSFNAAKSKYKKEYKNYCSHRCFLRTFMDLFCILHAIEHKMNIRSSNDLGIVSKKILKETKVSYNEFYRKLYLERKISREKDFKKWAKLTPLFPGIKVFLNSSKFRMYISTANVKETVERILKSNKIKFNPKNIMDNSFSHDKTDHFKKIAQIEKIRFDEIGFVDDQVKNLIKIKKLGVRCFLAGWGYNNKEQREEAKRLGIKILTLKKLDRTD